MSESQTPLTQAAEPTTMDVCGGGDGGDGGGGNYAQCPDDDVRQEGGCKLL